MEAAIGSGRFSIFVSNYDVEEGMLGIRMPGWMEEDFVIFLCIFG